MRKILAQSENLFLNLAQILLPQGPLANGALLIHGDRIKACGPQREVEQGAGRDARRFDFEAFPATAAPGFIDSHTHAVFAATRHEEYEMRCQGHSYEEISSSGGGILSSVQTIRETEEEDLFYFSRSQVARFLDFGTTTVEIKSGYGLDAENELKMLRVIRRLQQELPLDIVPTYLGAHAVPRDRTAERYVDEIIDLLPEIKRHQLAVFVDAFCEKGFFPPHETRRIFRAAQEHGFRLKLHADQLSYCEGGEIAGEFGCVSADHLEHVSDQGIEAMARSGTIATLLPGASLALGLNTQAPVTKLTRARIPVALATDFNPGTCFTQNMQLILTIACSQLKMTPLQAFEAATAHGAAALQLANSGALQPGKKADVVFFGVDDYRKVPYHFGTNHCVGVLKHGDLYLPEGSPIYKFV